MQTNVYRRRTVCFCLCIFLFILIHNVSKLCHDQYFLYRQGESILQNGFSVNTEYLTIHHFDFFNNRILPSLFCYFFGSFGEIGFVIGSIVLNSCLFFLLFFLLHKYVVRMSGLYFIFLIVGFYGLSHFANLRANSFMSILMIVAVVTCELYLDKRISFFGMCCLWFLYGALAMWIQDSAFYMLIFMLMPYLFDFRFLSILFKNKISTTGRVLSFFVFLLLYLIGGLCNPYGFDAYIYSFKCATAMSCDYVAYVPEMQCEIITVPNACFAVCIIVLLHYMIRIRSFPLRVIYFGFGAILFSIVARRMQYFSLIIVFLCIWILLRKDDVDAFAKLNHVVDDKILSVSTIVVLSVSICTVFVLSLTSDMQAYRNVSCNLYIAQIMNDNVDIKSKKVYNVHPDIGSHLEYYHCPVYIDDRAEFFDEHFNGGVDITNEWFNLANDNIASTNDEYHEFCSKYNFDYYIVFNGSHIGTYLADNAFCNYSDDTYCIYSFDDDRTFVVNV